MKKQLEGVAFLIILRDTLGSGPSLQLFVTILILRSLFMPKKTDESSLTRFIISWGLAQNAKQAHTLFVGVFFVCVALSFYLYTSKIAFKPVAVDVWVEGKSVLEK